MKGRLAVPPPPPAPLATRQPPPAVVVVAVQGQPPSPTRWGWPLATPLLSEQAGPAMRQVAPPPWGAVLAAALGLPLVGPMRVHDVPLLLVVWAPLPTDSEP